MREPETASGEGAARDGADGGRPRLPPPPRHPVWHSLLNRAEYAEVAAARRIAAESAHLPAWRRRTRGEHRWPVTISVIVAIVLQRLLPGQMALRPLPGWLLPALEGALLVGLAIANPVRIENRARFVRVASLGLILVITAANAASAVLLIRDILSLAPATSGPHCPFLPSPIQRQKAPPS